MTEAESQPRSPGLCIVGGSTDPGYALSIAEHLRTRSDVEVEVLTPDVELRRFLDGELFVRYCESLRGKDVFLVQSHRGKSTRYPDWSPNDAIQEHILMIDAAIGASAMHVTAIAPWFGYCRQDKKDDGRVPIAARRVARQLVQAGAERLVSMDLHSPQIQGFTDDEPVENLYASPVLIDHIQAWMNDKDPEQVVVVSPDEGRVKLNKWYADQLGVGLAIVDKERSSDSKRVRAMNVIGQVAGKHCVVIDDMIDTAKTLTVTGDGLARHGAVSMIAAATHGVLAGSAADHINNSEYESIILTDTINQEENQRQIPRLVVASVASIFSEAVKKIHYNESISEMFGSQRTDF